MCNAAINLLMKLDRRQHLVFAPLQGSTASELLPPLTGEPENWSMVYADETGVYDQSDAVIAVCRRVGGWPGIFGVFRVVPRSIRDAAYRWIARHRYQVFGKHAACRILTPAERARFLP